ncbi:MAG: hypothetical protein H0U71_03050 [Gammaproteobacteria bacterium]|nr:hypothetical protein [Gammaproteobacteria bacterium]
MKTKMIFKMHVDPPRIKIIAVKKNSNNDNLSTAKQLTTKTKTDSAASFAETHENLLINQSHAHQRFLELRVKNWLAVLQLFNDIDANISTEENIHPETSFTYEEEFDPTIQSWVLDHRPIHTVPVLPMMSIIDILAKKSALHFPDQKLLEIQDVKVFKWLIIEHTTTLRILVNLMSPDIAEAKLFVVENNAAIPIATGLFIFGQEFSTAPTPPLAIQQIDEHISSPYLYLFHESAFQAATFIDFGQNGSTMLLRIENDLANEDQLNQILLDAVTHGTYHFREGYTFWHSDIPKGFVSFPSIIKKLKFYDDKPTTGIARCETRFGGFYFSKQFPKFLIYVIINDKVWAELELIDALFPLGFIYQVPPAQLREYVRDKQYIPDVYLATVNNDSATLTLQDIERMQWFPYLLEDLYLIPRGLAIDELAKHILLKEFTAYILKVHPAEIEIENPNSTFWKNEPHIIYNFAITEKNDQFMITTNREAYEQK